MRGMKSHVEIKTDLEETPDKQARDDRDTLFQFGKLDKKNFSMDFRYPLSLFQAFSIALAIFDEQ